MINPFIPKGRIKDILDLRAKRRRSVSVVQIAFLAMLLGAGAPAWSQTLGGLAQVDNRSSGISDAWRGKVDVVLGLSQPVPYRVYALGNPNRIVVDFHVVLFDGLAADEFSSGKHVSGVGFGAIDSETSRLVLQLSQPMKIDTVLMSSLDNATAAKFEMRLSPTSQSEFDAAVVAPTTPQTVNEQAKPTQSDGPQKMLVALDPGHGGIDPGADGGRRSEADLMLLTAFELQDALLRSGLFEVMLTREDDSFVGLEERMSRARAKGANVFLSLHADAVTEGVATGSTIYTLSDKAGTEADEKLAARHNSADVLAGVNLAGQGDEIAEVLLEMVRRNTAPRSMQLAKTVVSSLRDAQAPVNAKALRRGDFAVLRSADIPSILIELGFLSSEGDRARLNTVEGRKVVIDSIVAGLTIWADEDAATTALIRQ